MEFWLSSNSTTSSESALIIPIAVLSEYQVYGKECFSDSRYNKPTEFSNDSASLLLDCFATLKRTVLPTVTFAQQLSICVFHRNCGSLSSKEVCGKSSLVVIVPQ